MSETQGNQFYGLSTLRAKERQQQPQSQQAKAMADYLKKYTSGAANGEEPKKKKRKKQAAPKAGTKIIDEDMSGFAAAPNPQTRVPRRFHDIAELSGDDSDGPVIANPGEAELFRRQQEKERSGAAYQNWTSADADAELEKGRKQRARHDSPDESPPRRRVRHDSPGESPPRRRQRHDSPDESPPRRQNRRHDSSDESPPRRPSVREVSPPRRQQRNDAPKKSSPRRPSAKDASPPRRRQKHDSPDESPPRRPSAKDASPPRRKQKHDSPDESPPRRKTGDGARKDKSGQTGKMLDGTSTGIISAKGLKREMDLKREAERRKFVEMEERHGSKYAQTVYRDRETGRAITKEELEAKQKEAAEKKRPKYETPEWGGGLKQKQERQEHVDEMRRQAAKPFARSLQDVDEDLNLKDRARFGDPMAHLVRRKAEAPPPPAVPDHMAKLLRKGGFAIPQEVPPHSWLKRNMGPPPNRYGIQPGRHWDGVDRSNGFERDMFKEIAARAAREREARAWAQADM